MKRFLLVAMLLTQLPVASSQSAEKQSVAGSQSAEKQSTVAGSQSAETAKPKAEKQKEAAGAAIPASQLPGRRELMRNKRVIVTTTAIGAGASLPMHRHERDYVGIILTDGQIHQTFPAEGADQGAGNKVGRGFSRLGSALHVPGATGDKVEAGDVGYHQAGYTHAEENRGKTETRAVTVEFLQPAGKQEDASQKSSKYCNEQSAVASSQSSGKTKAKATPDAKACVDERYRFCTDKFCVEEVTMDPGAASTKHSHSTDHMLIAISDYQLTDNIISGNPGGKPKKLRTRKAGEVEYIPAGITHVLTNTGAEKAQFVVIAFK